VLSTRRHDPFFISRSELFAALALRYGVPVMSQYRDFAAAGGLMAYGGNLIENYHHGGDYTGRVLNGEKPADLPVERATKIELIINLRTAKALGITIPPSIIERADEVIE
jgi:putative tryptophan/tyrosine transport system substrate-binding protein